MKSVIFFILFVFGWILCSTAQSTPSFHGTLHLILSDSTMTEEAFSASWHRSFNNQRAHADTLHLSTTEFVQISTSARPTKGTECEVLMGVSIFPDGACSTKLQLLNETYPDGHFALMIDGKIADIMKWNVNLYPYQLIVAITTEPEADLVTQAVGKNSGR